MTTLAAGLRNLQNFQKSLGVGHLPPGILPPKLKGQGPNDETLFLKHSVRQTY